MNNTTTTKPSVTVQAVPFNAQTQQFGTVTPQVQVVPPITPAVIPQSQNISTFGTQAINIPPVNVTQPTVSTVNEAESFIQRTTSPETEAQRKEKSLADIIYNIAPNLQGQTAYEDSEAKRLGRDEKLIQLNTLNNELRMKDAELRQDDIKLAQGIQNIEDKPIAMEFITGQQQSVARNAQIMKALKLSERDMMNARAIGLQGDIALAESMAKKAVETKYAPWKELLETVRLQQEALKPQLDADEKKQLREQEIKTKLAFNDIEKRQKAEESVSQMIVNAAAQNAPQTLLAKAQAEKDPAKAAMILGQYAGDYYKTELLKNQIATEKAQRAKIYSEMGGGNGGTGAVLGVEGINPLKFKDAQARTDFTKAGAVVEAIKATLSGAQKDENGNYYGLGYGGGNKPEVFLDQTGQTNRAFLSGINLKTQQWASGASLTKEQIDMVNKMVPQYTDADSTITRKLNALEKYMVNEQKAIARTQGQSVIEQPEPNVFTQALGQPASKFEGTSIIKDISDKGIDFALPTTTNMKVK